jgi:hypothetical protein
MVATIDGQLDVTHHEWLTETELLDTDNRPETPQSLWATWDGLNAFLGWQGGWWENEGMLWAYYDVAAGGTDVPVTGTVSLPFDADFAVSVEDGSTAYLWSYNGATWAAESFATLTWPQVGIFGHDGVLGETEFGVMFYNCCVGTDSFTSNRLMAFALDDNGSVWSAFPTANSLDGSFDYYYEWPITTNGWDLLNRPISAQEPFASLSFASQPATADTVSTDETIQYLLAVTNLEDEAADNLSVRLTASEGLNYQSVVGASCNDCAADDDWLLDIPTISGNGTQVITVTAQLAADLTGISQVTTTGQLTTALPVGSAVAIAHTIDISAPSVTINTNPGNALGVGLQAVKGTADDGLGAGVEMVEVSPDGINWQVASGTQSWTAALTVPAGTTYDLYARATDYHGQTGAVVMVTFSLDTAAPILTPTVPALVGGSPVGLFSGTAQDPAPAGARVQQVAMQLDSSGNAWQNGAVYVADANGVQGWVVGWTLPSEDGVTHTVRFRATDYAGNATLSGWYNTVVDTIAPAIVVSQHNPVVSDSGTTPALAGSVSDGTGVTGMSVLVYPEVGPSTEVVLTVNSDQWSYDPVLAIGTYKLLVVAEDTAGNQRIVGFYDLEVVAAMASITIVKEASPADGADFGFSGDLGSFTLDDASPDDSDAYTDTVTFGGLAAGSYTITETVTAGWTLDNISCDSGSWGSDSDSVTVTLADSENVTCTFYNSEVGATADILMSGLTADGGTTVTVTYQISGTAVPSFTIAFVKSDSSEYVVGTPALSSVVVSNPADLTVGVHSKSYILGAEISLVTEALETDEDYYLLAVADVNNQVGEVDGDAHNEDNTVVFQGVYHQAGAPIFVHGTEAADTITAGGASIFALTVNFNGAVNSYNTANSLRIRAHGGDDNVNLSGVTFGNANFKPFVAGGAGADNLTGGSPDETFLGGADNDTINGGGSADTVSYVDSPAGVIVNLTTGIASDGFGGTDSISSANHAIGSDFGDSLTGSIPANTLNGGDGGDSLDGQRGNDTLIGGEGDDSFEGGLGADTASYADSPAAVNADLSSSAADDGYGTTDSLSNVENLTGSAYDDTLTGDGGRNTLNGGIGHDSLSGGAGADVLQGQAGNDTLYANSVGSCADGAVDQIKGGPNSDTAYYNAADGDVVGADVEVVNNCS